jgi:hypothetical protein
VSGTLDELFEALVRAREAARTGAPGSHRDWRVIERWVRSMHLARRESDRDEIAQDTLLAIARHVGRLEATTPEGAAKWVGVIARHKRIDHLRLRIRERTLFAKESGDEPLIDTIERDDGGALDDATLGALIDGIEDAIVAHVEQSTPVARDRMLRKLQARACLHRLLGHDAEAIRAALRLEPDVSDERLYKWIERGRALVAAATEVLAQQAEEEALRQVLEALGEAAGARRVDAGIARPERRKGHGGNE